MLETQLPVWQNINFNSLDETDKQKMLEELLKNMKITEIAQLLITNLNKTQINEISIALATKTSPDERVISETDISELENVKIIL